MLILLLLLSCAFTLLDLSKSAAVGDLPTSNAETAKKITDTTAATDDDDISSLKEKLHAMEQKLADSEQYGTECKNHLFEYQQKWLRERVDRTNHDLQEKHVKESRREGQRRNEEAQDMTMTNKLVRNKQAELVRLEQQIERAKKAIVELGHQQQSEKERENEQHNKIEYPALANSIQFGQKRGLSPCDDFYKFVCSGQDKLYKEWDNSTGFNTDHHYNVKKAILEILFNNKERAEMEERIGGKFMANGFIYYDKCVNKRREAREAMKKLKQQAKEQKGQPMNQMSLLKLVRKHGKKSNVRFADLLDATPNALPMIQMAEGEFLVDDKKGYETLIKINFETRLFVRETTFNDAKGNAISTNRLQSMMLEMYWMGMFGKYDGNNAAIERRIIDMLDMETDFIEQLKASSNQRRTLISQLNREISGDGTTAAAIDWVQVMKRRFPASRSFDTKTQVIVDVALMRKWYKNILGVIGAENVTNKNGENLLLSANREQTISDYLNWHLLLIKLGPFENMAEMFNKWWSPLKSESIMLDSLLGKKNQLVQREGEDKQFCLKEHLLEFFPHVVDRMIHELLSKKMPIQLNVEKNKQILQYVYHGFEQMLKKNDWMDEKTRENALRKLQAMQTFVGFLPETLDDQKLDEDIYAGISLRPAMSWIEMMDQMLRHKQRRKFVVNKEEGGDFSFVNTMQANASYNRKYNWLFINALNFLEPSFNLQFPDAYNFGAIGHTMGHEITHGFDNSGRERNWKGVMLSEPGWWTEEALQTFNKRKECLQQQYKDHEIEKYRKDVEKTIDEDIADNGGLRAAYKGWQFFEGEHPGLPDKKIVHIDVLGKNGGINPATPEQLFFIGFAFSQCRVNTCDKTDINKECDDYDVHSIDRVRVNVPLRMFEQFHQAFQCEQGTPMNPVEQCRIW